MNLPGRWAAEILPKHRPAKSPFYTPGAELPYSPSGQCDDAYGSFAANALDNATGSWPSATLAYPAIYFPLRK